MTLNLDPLLQCWGTEDVRMLEPCSEADVRAAFEQLGATLTSDVLDLYTKVGGMQVPDNELWMLWPLDYVKERNSERSSHGVLFADYMLDCWGYRLQANADDTSAVLREMFDGTEPIRIANSLEEFFAAYASQGVSLLDPLVARAQDLRPRMNRASTATPWRIWKTLTNAFEANKH
jgi:hypothetical protein